MKTLNNNNPLPKFLWEVTLLFFQRPSDSAPNNLSFFSVIAFRARSIFVCNGGKKKNPLASRFDFRKQSEALWSEV